MTRWVIFVIPVGRRGNVHLGHDPGLHHAHRRSPPHGRGRPLGILGALGRQVSLIQLLWISFALYLSTYKGNFCVVA